MISEGQNITIYFASICYNFSPESCFKIYARNLYTFFPHHYMQQNINISKRKCTLISLAFLDCSILVLVCFSCSHVSPALFVAINIKSHPYTSV